MYMTCHRYTESAHKSICPKCAIRRYYTGRSNCPLQIRESGPQSAVSFFSSKHNVCCGAGEPPHSIAFVDSTSAWRRGAFWPRIMTWRVLTLSVITLYSRGARPHNLFYSHLWAEVWPSNIIFLGCFLNENAPIAPSLTRGSTRRRLINWLTYLSAGCALKVMRFDLCYFGRERCARYKLCEGAIVVVPRHGKLRFYLCSRSHKGERWQNALSQSVI